MFYLCTKKREEGRRLGFDKFVERARKIHGDSYNYDAVIYKNTKTPVKIYCNHCKQYFLQTPEKHFYKHGCPYCKLSKGEEKIRNILTSLNINYVQQHWFKDCRDINPLPFDFYLPDYNLCIEYQGRQHYQIVRHSKKETIEKLKADLSLRQLHDKIKREYCEHNEIDLLEIRFDEDVEARLKGKLDELR